MTIMPAVMRVILTVMKTMIERLYIFISVMYSAYIHVGYMTCVTVVYCDNSVCM